MPGDADPSATLRRFRAVRDFTQAEAAKWYGVSERSWRRWENTGTAPTPLMKRIAEYGRRRGQPYANWLA